LPPEIDSYFALVTALLGLGQIGCYQRAGRRFRRSFVTADFP